MKSASIRHILFAIILGFIFQSVSFGRILNMCSNPIDTLSGNDSLEINFNTSFASDIVECSCRVSADDNLSLSIKEDIYFSVTSALGEGRGSFSTRRCYTNSTCLELLITNDSSTELINVSGVTYTIGQNAGYGGAQYIAGGVILSSQRHTFKNSAPALTTPHEAITYMSAGSTTSHRVTNEKKSSETSPAAFIGGAVGGVIATAIICAIVVIVLRQKRNKMSSKPHGLRSEQAQEMELDVSITGHVYSLQEHETEDKEPLRDVNAIYAVVNKRNKKKPGNTADASDATVAMPAYAEVRKTRKLDKSRQNDNEECEMNTDINQSDYDDYAYVRETVVTIDTSRQSNGRSNDEMEAHNNNIYFIEETNGENMQRNSVTKVVDNDVYESYDGNRASNIANDSHQEATSNDDKYFADNYVLAGKIKEN